jgi:DNA-binding response OmpR family regulator
LTQAETSTDDAPDEGRTLRVGDVALDIDGLIARVGGRSAQLSYREFLLLQLLMTNAGRVLEREEIIDTVWGRNTKAKMADIYVRRVRKQLGDIDDLERHIRTVRAMGYVFDLPPE